MNNQNPIEIYQAQDGTTQVEVRFENDTVWLSLQQMADLFGRDKSVISRHLRNIYTDGELNREATVAKNATVQIEGKRQINRTIEYYNLDVIISVGYRVNSILGTKFRIWATARLKEYLTQGYTINQKRLQQNARELEQALALIQKNGKFIGINARKRSWISGYCQPLYAYVFYGYNNMMKVYLLNHKHSKAVHYRLMLRLVLH